MSRTLIWLFTVLVVPILSATILYKLDSFEPVALPTEELIELAQPPLTAAKVNDRVLHGSEKLGLGVLNGPEDVVYHAGKNLIYTGCEDGWIKRVTVNNTAADTVVEDWVNTGGRPLGLALGDHDEVIVADAFKGLLKISGYGKQKKIELLTDEAEGKKFNLTDGVDIAEDGVIYFTDASYKYNLTHHGWDILEGKPHGRLLSYDSKTKKTKVLLHHLHFANGVVVAPDQTSVIYCETTLRRCRRYYIKGEKSGRVEKFIDRLPGLPDNIHYVGHSHYSIALFSGVTTFFDLLIRYPFARKIGAIVERYIGIPAASKNSGVLMVNLEGNPVAHYYDPRLSFVTSAFKIGDDLYFGSVTNHYILRLDLSKHQARKTAL